MRARRAVAASSAAAIIALPVAASTGVEQSSPDGTTTETTPPPPAPPCASIDDCTAIIERQQAALVVLRRRERRARRRAYALKLERNRLRTLWRPTVEYALSLGAAVSGVPRWQMRAVAFCESTLNPAASNGRYRGLFALGWSPFGFSPFDPVASAISTGLTVKHDGGWRQWQCKP